MTNSDIATNSRPSVSRLERTWGHLDQYAQNQEVTVTIMAIQPGQNLGLQLHRSRGELWVVLDEGLRIRVDGVEAVYHSGDEIWIPADTPFGCCNEADVDVRVLQVGFGPWHQDDVVRLTDSDD